MKKNFFPKFGFISALLICMYLVWPHPFWYFSKNVILPVGEKIGEFYQATILPLKIFTNISQLAKDNKSLEEENNLLRSKLSEDANAEHFCQIEKQEQKFSSSLVNGAISAKIIGRTPETFDQTIIIDKGSHDAVVEGHAVVSSGILIGRVTSVSSNQSEVELITSHKSMIPVVFENSRESGLLSGGIEGIVVSDIPSNKQIVSGERILTSGLGGDLPSGILIGQVSSIVEGNGLFQSANVVTSVDLSSIEVVSVAR
jgi:rod shape-determining protein MreC